MVRSDTQLWEVCVLWWRFDSFNDSNLEQAQLKKKDSIGLISG